MSNRKRAAIEQKKAILQERRDANKEQFYFTIPAGTRQQSRDYLTQLAWLWSLHLRKSAGYSGHSEDVWINFRNEFGVSDEVGIYIRMNDKFNRLKSLVQKPENDQVNESIDDLLDDLASYSVIAKCIRKERLNSEEGGMSTDDYPTFG